MTIEPYAESAGHNISPVVRAQRTEPPREHAVNPLVRLHLLLYGRYVWAILLGLVLAAAGGVAAWKLMPPEYMVVGYVRVRPYIPPVLTATDLTGSLPAFEPFIGLQMSLLQSQRVLDQASLNPDWRALNRQSPQWGRNIPADGLSIQRPRNSELITVAYTDEDVRAAAVAVRSILRAYEKVAEAADGEGIAGRMQVLMDLQSSLNTQKRAINDQIMAIADEFGTDLLELRYRFKLEESTRLESALQNVALEIAALEAASGNAEQPAATEPAAATQTAPALPTPEEVARVDARMRDALAEESRLLQRLAQLRSRFGENYYEVVTTQNALRVLQERIGELLTIHAEQPAAVIQAARTDSRLDVALAELRVREAKIRALYQRVEADAMDLGRKDLQIKRLKQELDTISQRLNEAGARVNALTLEAKLAARISILNEGEMPNRPVASKRNPVTAASSMMGFAVGIGLVALRGLIDRRVRSSQHIQQLVPSVPILGMLPALAEDLADPEAQSLAAHCVHQIRNILEIGAVPGKGRVLAVTSPAAGDGKTSLALALGMSFAGAKSRTLMIDCDMVGGGLTRRLNAVAHRSLGAILRKAGLLNHQQLHEALRIAGAGPRPLGEVLVELGYIDQAALEKALADQKASRVGLLDAISGEPLSECIVATATEGLFVLPLGEGKARHTSQVSSKALRHILQQARAEYDFIIVDTGPIGGSLEASIVAREADEVILAVARGNEGPFVTRGLHHLEMLGAPVAGVVFNRATPYDIAHSQYGASSMGSLRSIVHVNGFGHEAESPTANTRRLGPVASAMAHGEASTASTEPSAP